MRKQEGEIGKSLHKSWVDFQDMNNFIFRKLTDKEKEDIWSTIERQNPHLDSLSKEASKISFEKGVVDGVKYRRRQKAEFKDQPLPDSPKVSYYDRKPGRIIKKIYVYRFIPDPYFASLGFKTNLPPKTLVMPQELRYTRDEIHEFRRTIASKLKKGGKKPGVVMNCAYCKELFLSRKKQTAPYVCTKHRCRKAKIRGRCRTVVT